MSSGASPFGTDTNGNPLLEQYQRTGQIPPELMPVIQRHAIMNSAGSVGPQLTPPQTPPPALTQPQVSRETPPAPAETQQAAAPTPMSAPGAQNSPTEHEYQRLLNSGTGISHLPGVARIPLQILDAIGSTFFPRLTEAIPGTALHHADLLNSARGAVNEEQNVLNEGQKRQLQQGQGQNLQSEIQARENPKPKFGAPIQTDQGFVVPNDTEATARPLMVNGQQAKPAVKPEKPENEEKPDLHVEYAKAVNNAIAEGRKPAEDPHVQEILEALTATQKQPAEKQPNRDDRQIAIYQQEAKAKNPKLTDEQAYEQAYQRWNKETKVDPGAIRMQILNEGRPVQTLDNSGNTRFMPAGEAMRTGALSAGNMPGSTRATRQFAQTVTAQTPVLQQEVSELRDELGPAAGRWNELWVNGAGMNDPEFAGLDQDLGMYANALVRVHYGQSGGENVRAALMKDFHEAQSPEDLQARIMHADKWVQGYATMGNPRGNASGQAPQAGGGNRKVWNEKDQRFE